MHHQRTVLVNGDKLKLCVMKKGLTLSEVSLGMGYASNYVTNASRNGCMSAACMNMLEHMYGIYYKDYKAEQVIAPEEPETPAEPEAPKAMEWNPPREFWTALYNHIFSAVYEAVKKAWSE